MKKFSCFVMALLLMVVFIGCSFQSDERIKLRDLDFTILSQEMIPEELAGIIAEKEAEPFKLTYSDNEYLYICIGYGEQSTGGYSIAVNELYLTDSAIYVNTTLLGPDASEKSNQTPSYPSIVIKTEYLDETVIFE